MMSKTVVASILLLFLAVFPIFALNSDMTDTDRQLPANSLVTVRTWLETGQTPEKSSPFIVREFKPFLDDQWIGQAVSYGCYRKGQAPGIKGPTREEILEDLLIISQYWNLIRVYNADDDTERILDVISENGLPVRVMLGVWLAKEANDPETRDANISNILRAIELAGRFPEIISAINVGNETQVFWSGHKLNTAALIRYIRIIRNNTSVPVTTADDYNFWNKPESAVVAAEVDFIVTHIYPLWNGKTLDNAIEWLDQTFQEINETHPQRQLVLGEIGWATNYNPEKTGPDEQGTLIKGEVSLPAQEKFLIALDNWIISHQVTTFLFEAFDEPWKGGGNEEEPSEIEKNWGVFYEDRTAKSSFLNFLLSPDKAKNKFLKEEK